jgi:hypothetical protein
VPLMRKRLVNCAFATIVNRNSKPAMRMQRRTLWKEALVKVHLSLITSLLDPGRNSPRTGSSWLCESKPIQGAPGLGERSGKRIELLLEDDHAGEKVP